MDDILVKLAEATGLPKAAPEMLAEVTRLQNEAGKVEVLSKALDTATTDLEAVRERIASLEANEKTRILDAACAEGRIAPTERDDYWALVEARGIERAQALFTENRLAVVGRDSSEAPTPDAAVAQTIEAEVLTLAEKIQTEYNLTEPAAYARAMTSILSDPTKLAAYEAESLDQ